MTKNEKKIKEDILNELEIPNVLNKLRPYAIEESASFTSEKIKVYSIKRVLVASFAGLACVFLVAMVIIIGSSNGKMFSGLAIDSNNKSYDMVENASESTQNSKDYERQEDAQNGSGANSSEAAPGNAQDVYSYYSSIKGNELSEVEINNYYSKIQTYVNEGKSKEEIVDIITEDDSSIDEETIEIIYDYIDSGN